MENEQNRDELVTQFINITGADRTIATNTLEAFNWNVELAVNMFVDNNLGVPAASSSTDNNDTDITETHNVEVRPPIPPVRQVLIEDPLSYSRFQDAPRSTSFDAFRNFEQETRWHEQQLLDEQSSSSSSSENKRTTLDDLFRPPLDLIFRGTFEMAKYEGQRQNKWLLINIQNPKEFSCQVLNRDVWSNPTVKSIISEHFIFWQTYHDNTEGQKFVNFYNVNYYPHVSIIDPRTGEKIKTWSEIDIMAFCDTITQFLNKHPNPCGANEKTLKQHFNEFDKNLYEESEEMQLKAAIQASLQDMQENFGNENSEKDPDAQLENDLPEKPIASNDWRAYLGSDESPKIEIVIRYPDGNKEKVIFPCTSKLKILYLYVKDRGYDTCNYDLITNFPKKILNSLDETITLEDAGIHTRDTLYVQTKN